MTTINHFLHKNCPYGSNIEHEFKLSKHTAGEHTDYRLNINSTDRRFTMTLFMDPDVRQDLLEILTKEPKVTVE